MAITQPECELLLCCARTRLPPAQVERLPDLLGGIDWSRLLRTAHAHGLAPLLYWHLNAICPAKVPKPALAQLQSYFHRTASKNLHLSSELVKLLRLFQADKIMAVPFKGPVLAASVYGNLLLREFSDLDILVRERDVYRAKALLVSQGFQLRLAAHETAGQEGHFLHHHTFLRDALCVEVHWSFAERYFSIPLDKGLWRRLEQASLAGTDVPNLAAGDLLLALCVHGARHRWERLTWICDVAELLRATPGLPWDQVLASARTMGIQRILFLGLLLARDLLQADFPPGVRRRADADPMAKCLSAQVREHLFRGTVEASVRESEKYRFDIQVRERLRDRVTYCRRLGIIPAGTDQALLPPLARGYLRVAIPLTANERDVAAFPLPASASFLYSLVRPIRLAAKLVRTLIGRNRPTNP